MLSNAQLRIALLRIVCSSRPQCKPLWQRADAMLSRLIRDEDLPASERVECALSVLEKIEIPQGEESAALKTASLILMEGVFEPDRAGKNPTLRPRPDPMVTARGAAHD